jgi:hypothetical protein
MQNLETGTFFLQTLEATTLRVASTESELLPEPKGFANNRSEVDMQKFSG